MHNFQNHTNIILGSQSPRRKEILNSLGISKFTQITSPFDEDTFTKFFKSQMSALEFISKCCQGKADALAEKLLINIKEAAAGDYSASSNTQGDNARKYWNPENHSQTLLITADTMAVDHNDEKYGKPEDKHDALKMLKVLRSNPHKIVTAVSLLLIDHKSIKIEKRCNFIESSTVTFRTDITDLQLAEYVDSGEPMGKAASYGYQGMGAFLIEKIEGDYWNIVGLPGSRLVAEINKILLDR